MDYYLSADNEAIRVPNSPRRSPQITQGLPSPNRSIHGTQMGSLHVQPDLRLRTVDFFDDSSDEGDPHGISPGGIGPEIDHVEGRSSTGKKRRTASTVEPFEHQRRMSTMESDLQGYQPLTADEEHQVERPMVDTASSSFHGSIEELLPSGTHSSPPQQYRSRVASEYAARSPTATGRPEQRHMSTPATKLDQTLTAHAIAHEITLNALIRDEGALDKTLQAYALAPLSAEGRQSVLPSMIDPRSPRVRNFSSPATVLTSKKAVHVVPPPIDTEASKRPIPDEIIRTPYPFTPDHPKRKDFGNQTPPPGSSSATESTTESILTISIRRTNPNSRTRVTSLTIPATNDFTAFRLNSIGAKERHFKALDFDDAEFFRELRKCYRTLGGPLLILSARSLTRIAVTGPAMNATGAGYGWRSPRVLTGKGLSDTFSEEQILRHYRKPRLGYSRYAFVHWAHRLASTAPAGPPAGPPAEPVQQSGEVVGAEITETPCEKKHPGVLEFVLTWSVRRILFVFLLVFSISTAAALLWIFLGRSTVAEWPPRGGFKDAGDRVGTGVIIGICVLLLGLSTIGGWLGVSWLLM